MNESYLNSVRNTVLSSKPSTAIRLLLMVLFVCLFSNMMSAQTASSTWALISNGNSANVGNVTGTVLAIGSGLNSISYGTTAGVTTGSWSNNASSLRNDEYYEFEVTPNASTIFNVTAINFEHSVSNGNWQVQAYYSKDGFLTSTAISTAFSSNSAAPTVNNNTVNINVEASTLSVRIYGWGSDGSSRSLRIKNVVISGTTCVKPNSAATITGSTTVCQGQNNVTYSVPAITNATGYTWTLPSGATIISGANTNVITVNYSSAATSGNISVQGTNTCGNGTVSTNYPVTVNAAPTVTSVASPTIVASAGNVTLTASVTTPTTQNTVLLYEGFNGGTNTWAKTNGSSGGTTANAAWTLRPNGYVYNYPGYPVNTFNSNDNSQFYLTNSAAQGSGSTTSTILQSPVMNTVGYTSLSLEFFQYFLNWDTNDYGRVEVSTDGSSWTTVRTITTTQGAENNFLQTTINLNAYINQSTLYVRFKYDAQFDWFWAIDNVTISGNKTIDYTYSWTALPSGTAGLPSGAGTASVSNNSIVANPIISTAYTVTATNPITGCVSTSSVNVTVLTPTITSLSSTSGCVGSSITINGTNLSGATAANVKIGGTPVSSITSISETQIVAVIGGGTTGNVTVTNSGGTATSGSVFTVNVLPTITTSSTPAVITAVCQSSSSQTTTMAYTATSGTPTSYSIDWATLADQGSTAFAFTAGAGSVTGIIVPAWTSGGTYTGTMTITNGNGCTVTKTITLTVNSTPVGGGIYTGNTPICINSSTGAMNLTGYTGTVVRWEKRLLPSTTWTNIANTTATYSESLSVGGTWEYRAVVGSGSCATVNSTAFTVVVNPASVGGTVSGGSTPICQGASIGTLTLTGYTGTILRWERQVNSGGWNYAGGGSATFTETAMAGTCEYRAVVQSGSCATANSSSVTIVVSPTPVGGGIYTGNTPICINSSTGAMNLTGYTGTVVRWEKRLLPSTTWTNIANTTATYTESPSVGGTWEYRAVVGSGSCATVYSSVKQVVVNPELTIALTNSNATICQTTTTASFAYSSTTGSPAGWIVNFNSAAISAGFSSPQNNSISGTSGTITVNVPWSVATGVYNATLTVITYFPACSSVSYPITVTVGVSTPIVGTITNLNCATPTGSVVLSGLPASGTINQTGTVVGSYPITGTTMTISGLAAGTYNFSASNGTCSSLATGNVVINPVVTNTWTTSWSNGTPNSNQKLVFTGTYPPAVDPDLDINGCSCMISGGAAVTIKSGRTLTITNEVTVVGGGTLTFEDKASLVQINNVVNSGDIIYKRTTSSVLTSDYTYWSSPVANQNLSISPSYASGMFYSYNDFAAPEDWKSETATSVMLTGKGYIIRGPQITGTPPPPGLYNATFKGVPNNGTKTIAIGSTGTSNLLGNPYPSAISADAFLAANSSLVEGTIYFWTHNTAIQIASNIASGKAGSGVLAYTSDDYASYNTTGGVATGNFVNGVEEIGNKPTGKIAAGQAFFTTSLGAGTVTFNNTMRLSSGGAILDNSQFFKTKNPNGKTAKAIEKNRIWLNLTNTEGAFKQTLVGYVTDATNEYDSRFDGESFDANEFVDFYSVNQDKNLVIQGRALPFDENDEVPLGYRTTIDGAFTINIDQVDGALINQEVFLEDKLTNKTVNLKSGDYAFNTAAGTFNDRFVLKYSSKTLSVDETDKEDGILVLYSNNYKTLIIHNNIMDSTVNSVSLFNVSGQNIASWDVKNSEQTNIQIPIKDLSTGIYIVKVKTTKGESSKKIIVN